MECFESAVNSAIFAETKRRLLGVKVTLLRRAS